MGANDTSVKAVITVDGKHYAKILALKKASKYKRSSMSVRGKGGTLTISIEAQDVTALRATINSVLRDMQVASAIIPINQRKGKSIKRYTSNR
ncbi:MAG: KEOPS complex subunit Pcc1 [Candidatus Micrarchaeia archaeon]